MFGLETALILNRFQCAVALSELAGTDEKQNEEADSNSDTAQPDKESSKTDREYIEHRLAQLRRWQRSLRRDQD